nr:MULTISPECIES: urease accessory protein UreF [Mesorhizobium]
MPTAILTTVTITTMTDQPSNIALLRLMAWLSPAFPVGGFAYSHGLERAVHDGLVADAGGLVRWLETLVEMGSGWNDAVLFAESWRRARHGSDLDEVAALAEALAGSRERHTETMLQGAAFLKAATAWSNPVLARLPAECAYCAAVGAIAGGNGIALQDALCAFLQAFFSNLVQAAIRLGVVGQSEATALLAGFEPLALSTAARASRSTLDDLGGCAFVSDVMAMKHETQYSRLFRS